MPKGRAESFSDCVIAFPPTSVDSAIFARRGTQGHSPEATNIYRSIRARFLEMGEYGFFFVVGEHDEDSRTYLSERRPSQSSSTDDPI